MKRKMYYSVRRWDNQKKTYLETEVFIEEYTEEGECIWIDPLSKKKYLYHFLDNYLPMTAKHAKQRRAQIQKKETRNFLPSMPCILSGFVVIKDQRKNVFISSILEIILVTEHG